MATCSGQFIDDLVLQILPLLPLESLSRFKSVSKQWLSLISNAPRPVPALLVDYQEDMHLLPLDTTCNNHQSFPHPGLELLQSCNGLLLFQAEAEGRPYVRKYQNGPSYTTTYHLYNPLTRQRATLPLCPCCLHSRRVHVTATLAYDPSRSPHYKLLCLCPYYVMIYSSLTSSWTSWADPSFEAGLKGVVDSSYYTKPPLYWNGSVYYVSDAPDDLYKLYRFEVDREVMLETKLPYDDSQTRCVKLLIESWGRLYLLGSLGGKELEVYEMESDLSGWRLKYRLDDFGRDLELRFYRGNSLKIRHGRKNSCIRSDRYGVFFPAAESGDEEELWLVLMDTLLVYRYGLESKSVAVVKARQRRSYCNLKAHEFAETISELPRPDHLQ